MGRSLGRVRDADIRVALLRYFELRVPSAALSLVSIRQNQERDRLILMRKLVKRFERLKVERELTHLAGRAAWRRGRPWTVLTGAWRNRLRDLVAERAHDAGDAIAHATGVYFPNRAHQARIAIKKCRYAAEIGVQTGIMTDAGIVRELKKGQDLLGDLHDRQSLLDQLRADRTDRGDTGAEQIRIVTCIAEAELDDLHRRFLSRRQPLLASIDAARRAARHTDRAAGALAIAGVVVLGSGLEALRRRQHARQLAPAPAPEPERAVSVRIPVALGSGQ
jgi:CHAD domain-containing protein